MSVYQAHRDEPEPPLDAAYLIKCLLCLGLLALAGLVMYFAGWIYFGPAS